MLTWPLTLGRTPDVQVCILELGRAIPRSIDMAGTKLYADHGASVDVGAGQVRIA